jgi:hypothetical protein
MLEAPMNNPTDPPEWWDAVTVNFEKDAFIRRYGILEGKTATELGQILGEPDSIMPEGYTRRQFGNVTLVADSVWYYSLLPHTTVGVALCQGIVHHLYFMPKAKGDSAER